MLIKIHASEKWLASSYFGMNQVMNISQVSRNEE